MLLFPRYLCLAPHEECKSPSAPSPAAESASDTLDLSKIHYDDLAAAKAAHRAAKQAKLQGNTAEAPNRPSCKVILLRLQLGLQRLRSKLCHKQKLCR